MLLYRLVSLELGRPLARPALLLLAVFPAALFFGAPYAESLFLLLAVGAFYAARTDRWAWAGACAAGAAATRSAGVLLTAAAGDPVVESRGRRAGDAAWLAARAARPGRLRALPRAGGGRRAALPRRPGRLVARARRPLAGAWDGLGAAFDGLRQLASGQRETVYFETRRATRTGSPRST